MAFSVGEGTFSCSGLLTFKISYMHKNLKTVKESKTKKERA